MSSQIHKTDATLMKLLAALCDETITNREMEQLESLLIDDPRARQIYIHYLDLHAELTERFEYETATGDELPTPKSAFRPRPAPSIAPYVIVGTLLLAVTAAVLGTLQMFGTDETPVAVPPEESIEDTVPDGLEPPVVPTIPAIAAITEIDQVVWAEGVTPLAEGDELRPGTLRFLSGQLRVEFYCGASVSLEGPAEFRLIDDSRAHLEAGKMAAVVPEEAIGFVVSSPGVAVVDFGTEFALNVDESGKSEIHVFEGEVEASLLGDDGASLRSTRLFTGDAVEIDVKKAKIAKVRPRRDRFIRVKPLKFVKLNITPAYVDEVMQSEPLGYWRFEMMSEDGLVPNTAGTGFAMAALTGVKTRGVAQNRVALFQNVAPGGCLLVDEPFVGVNSGDFTIEFWVNPHVVKGASLVGLMAFEPEEDFLPGEDSPVHKHLTAVRLCQKSKKLVHPTGALHVVHRWPAGSGGGTNVFSNKACTPGRWHHVAVVRKDREMTLYLNGRKVRSVRVNIGADPLPYQLFAGRLPQMSVKNRFKGDLDELALYPRALTAKEIQRHYTLVSPPKPRPPSQPRSKSGSKSKPKPKSSSNAAKAT